MPEKAAKVTMREEQMKILEALRKSSTTFVQLNQRANIILRGVAHAAQ